MCFSPLSSSSVLVCSLRVSLCYCRCWKNLPLPVPLVSLPLSPTHFSRKTFFRVYVYFVMKIHVWYSPLSSFPCVIPSFLWTHSPPWKGRRTLIMLSFSARLFSISTPRLSLYLYFSFFHYSPHFLSPSAPLLLQWASNWVCVIGREKRLGEKWKAEGGEKKGKALMKSLI